MPRLDDKIAWYENTGDDCNGNRVPNICEPDADADSMLDDYDPCASGAASADTNADGLVDSDDYSDLETCLTGPDAGLGDGCECFDFESYNDVDLEYYAEFQRLFGS